MHVVLAWYFHLLFLTCFLSIFVHQLLEFILGISLAIRYTIPVLMWTWNRVVLIKGGAGCGGNVTAVKTTHYWYNSASHYADLISYLDFFPNWYILGESIVSQKYRSAINKDYLIQLSQVTGEKTDPQREKTKAVCPKSHTFLQRYRQVYKTPQECRF